MKTSLLIEGKTLNHFCASKSLEMGVSILGWLKSASQFPKFYFNRGEREVGAVGSLLSLPTAPRFDRGNTSEMRFFGGQAFFPKEAAKDDVWSSFPRSGFVAPKEEVVVEKEHVTHFLHSLEKEPIMKPFMAFELPPLSGVLGSPVHVPSENDWIDLIEEVVTTIEQDAFSKVVMARRSEFQIENCCPFALAERLKASHKEACIFLVQFEPGVAFVGATPERLFWREGGRLYSEAIAGTRPRGSDAASDLAFEEELKNSVKERSEFAFVKHSIEEALDPLVTSFSWRGEDGIIKTPVVQHFHCSLEGALRQGTCDQMVIEALHPTAAMGGAPRSVSLNYLKEKEPFERGWYAAPMGFTSAKWAEFFVGIRSALVEEKGLHLFAGAGIVAGSRPLNEWNELGCKMQTMQRMFV